MGRPTDFTPELTRIICELIAGGLSLRAICQDGTMPGQTTVFRWLADPARAEFREQYARAREAALMAYEEDILDLSEAALTYTDKEGNERIDQGDVARRKLRADNLKWLMSKLAPKKYGDKLELGGSVGRYEATLDLLDELERRKRAKGASDSGSEG